MKTAFFCYVISEDTDHIPGAHIYQTTSITHRGHIFMLTNKLTNQINNNLVSEKVYN
jgi:hypothetical protein